MNKAKKKGTAAETRVVKFLKEHDVQAERRALQGANDTGDIEACHDGYCMMLEVKAGKQTVSPSRTTLDEWKRQTAIEALHGEFSNAALVVATHYASVPDYTVYVKKGKRWLHMYLDDLVRYIKSKGRS